MPEQITIQGKIFTAPTPYDAGHVLNANEASALNQLLHENLRNNFASKVKEAVEAGTFDQDQMQASFDKYAEEYEFGIRRGGGGRTTDPVLREAISLALEAIKNQLRSKGKNPADYDQASMRERAKEWAQDQNRPFWAQAEQSVALTRAAADEAADDLDFQLASKAAPSSGNGAGVGQPAA